jgi:predicted ATP-dependent protease
VRHPLSLTPEQLRLRCDPKQFSFKHTGELERLSGIVGQERALNALKFGLGVRRSGFHLYVMGPPGTGKHSAVEQHLCASAKQLPTPDDWCYLHNFVTPYRPLALRLPAGLGAQLSEDMSALVEALRLGIPSAFRSEEYQVKVQEIEEKFRDYEDAALDALREQAGKHSLAVARTASGYMLAPEHAGEMLDEEAFQALPATDRDRFEEALDGMQEYLQGLVVRTSQWRQQAYAETRELERSVCHYSVGHLLQEMSERYADYAEVLEFLQRVGDDIADNVSEFYEEGDEGEIDERRADYRFFRRYLVNVLEQHRVAAGAPVIYEDHPTYQNVIGRIEHHAEMGAISTDFTQIKAGALHRANGGYLILDAHKLLDQPNAWGALKRALRSSAISLESPEESRGLVSTASMQPEPIPLAVKVVLIGERELFQILAEHDTDFVELFKVAVDFDDALIRSADHEQLYARLVATLAQKESLRPLNPAAVARIVEYAARLADDQNRLSLHARSVTDLLIEADYWAAEAGKRRIDHISIDRALEAQQERLGRSQGRFLEEFLNEIILVKSEGARVGQVNALTVLDFGQFAFGQASRISASVRLGDGEVLDIEREVDLGGSVHAKGVMILNGFLGGRFGRRRPLSLGASLVFEQSYGPVDGDSASLGELCALMSALGDLPINQGLAITGSVNQHGEVQAVGGLNEKVEGFFRLCEHRGLTGEQGVILPAHNKRHLMLSLPLVEAVRKRRFHIYAVSSVDEAMALLTGVEAGSANKKGRFPKASVNGRVQRQLDRFADIRNPPDNAGKKSHSSN